jgi:hypothetical protein
MSTALTAVVAVMYLNGKTRVNLHNANSQKSEILIGPERPVMLSKTLLVSGKSKTLIGRKKPFEHSKRLIVPERLSGSSSTLAWVGTSFSWRKDPLRASPL